MAVDAAFWENEQRYLLALFLPRLTQMALSSMTSAARQAGIAFDNTLYNQQAEAWAKTYTDKLLEGFISTSKTQPGTFVEGTGAAISAWIARPNATVAELNAAIEKLYGRERANTIAVTETTRAFSSGQEEAYTAEGITDWTWNTSRDALTCPSCGPLNKKTVKIGQPFGYDAKGNPIKKPPFHPKCRCWVSPAIRSKKKADGAPVGAGSSAIPVITPPVAKPVPVLPALDLEKLKQVNLHIAEPSWNIPASGKKMRYGGVIFDDQGRVLLRKPTGNYDGYAWTFPKGGGTVKEHPAEIALREVEQESGHTGQIVGLVPGGYESGSSRNYFFVMRSAKNDPTQMDKETEAVTWATPEEARELIKQSTNESGRQRDLNILDAAVKANAELLAGKNNEYLFKNKAAEIKPEPVIAKPPKPKKVPAAEPKPVVFPAPPPFPDPHVELKPKPTPKGFPQDVSALKMVSALGGSTGAKLMQDATGKKFVVKRGASADHILEEASADALYQALGVRVPAYQVYNTPEGPVKVAEYIPNAKTLREVLDKGTPADVKKVKQQLQKDFAADVLLSNWDVVGMNADNILVDEKGNAWRVDNGGSLRFRAQGGRKTELTEYPTELWSLRSKENEQAAAVFGSMNYAKIVEQMRDLVARRAELLAAASDDLHPVINRRLDQIESLVETSKTMTGNGWKDDYQDHFGQQTMQLRKDGVSNKLPASLTAKIITAAKSDDPRVGRRDVVMKDQSGKAFDSLRGPKSTFSAFHESMRNAGGRSDLLVEWMSQQGGDSWNKIPEAYKYYVATKGKNKPSDFWWKKGVAHAKKSYEEIAARYGGEEVFRKTFDAYHAFTYELLTKTEIPNVDRQRGVAMLWRTEGNEGVGDAKPGDKGVTVKRGAAESTSLLNPVYVKGDILTYQEVPLTDILGTYLTERDPGSGGYAFYGDHENEFVAMLGSSAFDYVAKGHP
jgi:SPP1 gp7 family putative phage head morphogenesis protein